ncbi:membrane-associated protein, putative [Bodo saltans]|uniref:Membrane-associated protein, putative n=1 Tax=Bodo saltans TaxID=75058 RepID=A0A0S4JA98_BODSA|nr:membrane-associated protein, putative [Bodo saltans]|eukprot:CUG88390.1 membrane-associated protein, putative [Bodo saltans]
MRFTLLVQIVFIVTAVMLVVVLRLGENDSSSPFPGSSVLFAASPSRSPLAQRLNCEDDDAPCDRHQWTGGGVHGLSEGEENVALDNVSAELRAASIDLFKVPLSEMKQRHLSRVAPHTITRFRRLFMAFAANKNKDCWIRMDPLKQLQCHLWANKLNSIDVKRSALFSGVPVDSLCSVFLSCTLWKRGRHGRQLTPSLLQGVFRTLRDDDELLNSSQLMLRNVIHGGTNWHEYPWLPNGLKVCEDLIVGRSTSAKSLSTIDVRAVFQGGDLTMQQVAGPDGLPVKRLATRDNGSPNVEFTRTLTSLEAMSVLYHRATNGGRPQPIVYPATSNLRECRTTAINVLLLTGDSMARQLFWRIVELLRHGPQGQVRVPYGSTWVNTSLRYYPTQRHGMWYDLILEIYPGHDELHRFESLMPYDTLFHGAPYKRSPDTVHRFFSKIVEQRRHNHCGGDDSAVKPTVHHEEPLFYLVLLFDAITSRPRTDALAPCVPAMHSELPSGTNSFDFKSLQRAVARGWNLMHDPPISSLRALGIRIPLHVHNANAWERHESPTTFDWLGRMATQCNVTTAPPSASFLGNTTSEEHESSTPTSDWIVGEHPISDSTYFYRAATQLRHNAD